MLKWDTDNGLKSKSLRVTVRTTAGISGYDATPADLIACLKANPEACAEVMRGLNIAFVESIERLRKVDVLDEVCQALGVSPLAGAKAPNMVRHLVINRLAAEKRAEQAERSRDEWRAKWEDLETHRAVCCDQMERERDALTEERDALKAKLAEVEARCSALARSDIQSAALARLRQEEIVGLHAKHDLYRRDVENTWFAKTQAAESRASAAEDKLAEAEEVYEVSHRGRIHAEEAYHGMRRKAEAAERVVEAARVIRLGRSRLPAVGPDAPGVVTVAWIEGMHKLEDALRAYDAAQAKDSGGSGAAPASADEAQSPEPAGTTAAEEWTTNDDLNADACEGIAGATPATLSDLDALEERIVERVARACDAAQDAPRDWGKPEPGSLDWLADELRRKP